jgi:hypothetical protein
LSRTHDGLQVVILDLELSFVAMCRKGKSTMSLPRFRMKPAIFQESKQIQLNSDVKLKTDQIPLDHPNHRKYNPDLIKQEAPMWQSCSSGIKY